ncbi:hypothetical protein HanIR_Chr17g0902221 [Helianthus annuus]|nr:hypothetical protein HanIR_Chr17g0902221 [Helianthus annuus]
MLFIFFFYISQYIIKKSINFSINRQMHNAQCSMHVIISYPKLWFSKHIVQCISSVFIQTLILHTFGCQ